jgi:hypothetical protein
MRRLLIPFVVAICVSIATCSEAGAGGGGSDGMTGDDPDSIKPSASFTVTPNPNTGYVTIWEEMIFDAGASDSNVPERPIVGYRWDFYYDFRDEFDPQLVLSTPLTEHTYRRYQIDGFAVGLVVIDSEGVESDVFVRNLWIEDREGGILVVE